MINKDCRFKIVNFSPLSDYENLNCAVEDCKEDFIHKTDELISMNNYKASIKNYNYFNDCFSENLDIFDTSIIKAQIPFSEWRTLKDTEKDTSIENKDNYNYCNAIWGSNTIKEFPKFSRDVLNCGCSELPKDKLIPVDEYFSFYGSGEFPSLLITIFEFAGIQYIGYEIVR
jgi:hypothetical protein